MVISNFLATALLNQVFRNTAYTRPTTVYIALYTTNPTGADTGAEVSGGAYVRQVATFSAPALESSKETIKINAEIVFPIATADWGTVTHIGIRDALTAGNLLYYGPITNQRTILSGDRLRIQADAIVLTLS
ncbi:phage tail fiber protein [Paenibacillus radicis (ex Xue et al. 2023)]|uniref:DUF4183 domain-containing protein n=1 Tax=Paenibacillus radicis (ex Xue et al. 2023) TaxID=2972489 RepID=A0ABT1YRU8_9BACL|nr:hypothetical protein [Paenibacillus radicis (ex Xue et al. 2023)]MCR8635742.1 hypothetical protein [Paenibacillus radicis (ex Xue et al. 2023)]